MSKVKVMDHPLIQHKIGVIRRKDTCSKISVQSSVRSQC